MLSVRERVLRHDLSGVRPKNAVLRPRHLHKRWNNLFVHVRSGVRVGFWRQRHLVLMLYCIRSFVVSCQSCNTAAGWYTASSGCIRTIMFHVCFLRLLQNVTPRRVTIAVRVAIKDNASVHRSSLARSVKIISVLLDTTARTVSVCSRLAKELTDCRMPGWIERPYARLCVVLRLSCQNPVMVMPKAAACSACATALLHTLDQRVQVCQ